MTGRLLLQELAGDLAVIMGAAFLGLALNPHATEAPPEVPMYATHHVCWTEPKIDYPPERLCGLNTQAPPSAYDFSAEP